MITISFYKKELKLIGKRNCITYYLILIIATWGIIVITEYREIKGLPQGHVSIPF